MEHTGSSLGEGFEPHPVRIPAGALEGTHDQAPVNLADDARPLPGDLEHRALSQTHGTARHVGIEAEVGKQVDDRRLWRAHRQSFLDEGLPPALAEPRHVGRDVPALSGDMVRKHPGE